MKLLVAFCFLLVFTGCTVSTNVTSPENFSINTPQLNVQQEIEIGISLVSTESGFKYKALQIIKNTKIKTGYLLKEIKEGEKFINTSYTSKYDLYSKMDGSAFGIALPKSGGNAISYYINGTGVNFNKNSNTTIEYNTMLTPIPHKEYKKQDFIYNGKVGNAIKFTYREFVDDLARPAFTQDLQYDLTESSIIGFKGLRIEILSATNTKIQYKVLSYYTK